MFEQSPSIAALATALATAQAEVENATKNSANPHFRSKYADLAEVLNTVRPVFAAQGLALVQSPSYGDGIASVVTQVCHKSGEWLRGTVSAPVSKADAQGVGSAITYLRRYSLAALCGVAQEDDDGNSAVGRGEPVKPQGAPAKPYTAAPKPAPAVKAAESAPSPVSLAELRERLDICASKVQLAETLSWAEQQGVPAEVLAAAKTYANGILARRAKGASAKVAAAVTDIPFEATHAIRKGEAGPLPGDDTP